MKSRIVWFVSGVLIGVVGTSLAAGLDGDGRVLVGWDVSIAGSGMVCTDPSIYPSIRAIECDPQ